MIVLPATLRKQWEIELEEKFDLESSILDRLTVDKDRSTWKAWLENSNKTKIAIVSYDYSSKLSATSYMVCPECGARLVVCVKKGKV